jgi:hypothetical protein
MSKAAARAMRDLADCMDGEAADLPAGMAYATMTAMARAHRKAAERIERWTTDPQGHRSG